MSHDRRTVLVTGGNGGIGRHLVAGFLAAGMEVTVADLGDSACDSNAAFIATDLSRPGSVSELGDALRASPPDILVNLAGLNAFCGFESMQRGQLERLLQVNLLAPIYLVHAVLPAMISRGNGQIANVGSVLGAIGLPYFAAYATSKAGIERFSESLKRELSGRGVDVTYIAPRAVRTAMNHGAIERFNERSGAREDAPERVAAIMCDAILKKRTRMTIGFPEKLFVKLNALLPSLMDRALIRKRGLAEDVLAAHSLQTGYKS